MDILGYIINLIKDGVKLKIKNIKNGILVCTLDENLQIEIKSPEMANKIRKLLE